jgi:methionine-rich copper-binding protein CopC
LSGNEEVDPERSRISVLDSTGRRVDDGKGGVDLNDLDRRSMIVRLKPLKAGVYTVKWKAVSAPDLSVAQGVFRFRVVSGSRG